MINENKVRLMTKAAMIEEQNKKALFSAGKFRSSDYRLFYTIKAVIGMSLAYFVIVFFIFADKVEALTTQYSIDGLISYAEAYLFIYIGLVVFTIIISIVSCTEQYWKNKDIAKEYDSVIKKLNRGYKRAERREGQK